MKTTSKHPWYTSFICNLRAWIIYLLLTLPLLVESKIYVQSLLISSVVFLINYLLFSWFLMWYAKHLRHKARTVTFMIDMLLIGAFLISGFGTGLSYAWQQIGIWHHHNHILLFSIVGLLSFSLSVWSCRRLRFFRFVYLSSRSLSAPTSSSHHLLKSK